jgi:hypothetical protein
MSGLPFQCLNTLAVKRLNNLLRYPKVYGCRARPVLRRPNQEHRVPRVSGQAIRNAAQHRSANAGASVG